MISFKEFIVEDWDHAKIEAPRSRWGRKRHSNYILHSKEIHGKKVEVAFGTSRDKPHHYEVGYTVDGAHYTPKAMRGTPQQGREIAHHASKTIHRFIKRVRPKSVYFHSADSQRQRIHKGLIRHLAKKYGGKASERKIKLTTDLFLPPSAAKAHKVTFR